MHFRQTAEFDSNVPLLASTNGGKYLCYVYVALFCNALETVPKLGADRDVGRNRHYAKIEAMGAMGAMGAMVAMAAMLCCFRMFQAFFVQSTYRLT